MMTRELVGLIAAQFSAADTVGLSSAEEHVRAARRLLAEVQRQGIDRVKLDVRCEQCSRSALTGGAPLFEFDSRQWVALMHEPLKRPCGHSGAPLRFTVDFLEAPIDA